MKKIENFGGKYFEKYLKNKYDDEKLQYNWWEALKFFFDNSFMRGRKNKLSEKYRNFTVRCLEEFFSISEKNLEESYEKLKSYKKFFDKNQILDFKRRKGIKKNKNCIKHGDFQNEVSEKNPIIKLLTVKNDKVSKGDRLPLNNDKDLIMVLDTLKFICRSDKTKNIYLYLKRKIEGSGVKEAYNQLIMISYVGDKIACLIIRDIGLLNPKLINNDYEYVFPVDTWVKKIAKKMGCKKENKRYIKKFFIEKCKKYKIDPLKFAAGLWYMGTNCLDLLIEEIKKIGYIYPNSIQRR